MNVNYIDIQHTVHVWSALIETACLIYYTFIKSCQIGSSRHTVLIVHYNILHNKLKLSSLYILHV